MSVESSQALDRSVTIPRELINVAQVTCLLTVAMIEGQGTPYWFLERLLPEDSPEYQLSLSERAQLFDRLKDDISPLARYLLKTYDILEDCWRDIQPKPFSEREQIWLLDRIQDLVPTVFKTSTSADKERNPMRIIGLLVHLVQTVGNILLRLLPERIDPAMLHEMQESMHGVAALYQAIGYASREQRDVLTNELEMLVPVIASIEEKLRQAINA